MTAKLGNGIRKGLEAVPAFTRGTADESQYAVHPGERGKPIPRKGRKLIPPLHPGEMLREEFLIPLRMTAKMLAKEIKAPAGRVVAIVEERRGLEAEMCLRLARFFRMSPEFWMNIQKGFELETAKADWRRICKEVRLHPKDRKTGGLKVPKISV